MGLRERDKWHTPHTMVFRHVGIVPVEEPTWYQELNALFDIGYQIDPEFENWFVDQVGKYCYEMLGFEKPIDSSFWGFEETLALIGYRAGIFTYS